jgi:hypothetical protein
MIDTDFQAKIRNTTYFDWQFNDYDDGLSNSDEESNELLGTHGFH